MSLHPEQRRVHPFAEGISWDLWLARDVGRQAEAYYATIPPEERKRRAAEFEAKHPIKTGRDLYGMKGPQPYRNNLTS